MIPHYTVAVIVSIGGLTQVNGSNSFRWCREGLCAQLHLCHEPFVRAKHLHLNSPNHIFSYSVCLIVRQKLRRSRLSCKEQKPESKLFWPATELSACLNTSLNC